MSPAIDLHPPKTLQAPISRKFGPVIPEVKRINLALQGGSAHGAFTWGVLDRLLEEPRIEVEGVSATSAGARRSGVGA
jgi:predicted acylesterase/phospholipase RssA